MGIRGVNRRISNLRKSIVLRDAKITKINDELDRIENELDSAVKTANEAKLKQRQAKLVEAKAKHEKANAAARAEIAQLKSKRGVILLIDNIARKVTWDAAMSKELRGEPPITNAEFALIFEGILNLLIGGKQSVRSLLGSPETGNKVARDLLKLRKNKNISSQKFEALSLGAEVPPSVAAVFGAAFANNEVFLILENASLKELIKLEQRISEPKTPEEAIKSRTKLLMELGLTEAQATALMKKLGSGIKALLNVRTIRMMIALKVATIRARQGRLEDAERILTEGVKLNGREGSKVMEKAQADILLSHGLEIMLIRFAARQALSPNAPGRALVRFRQLADQQMLLEGFESLKLEHAKKLAAAEGVKNLNDLSNPKVREILIEAGRRANAEISSTTLVGRGILKSRVDAHLKNLIVEANKKRPVSEQLDANLSKNKTAEARNEVRVLQEQARKLASMEAARTPRIQRHAEALARQHQAEKGEAVDLDAGKLQADVTRLENKG